MTRKLLTKVSASFDRINDFFAIAAAGLLVFMTLSTSAEVVMRYFLGRPTLWTAETSEYSIVFITFLGAAWVLRREGHVGLDIMLDRLKSESRALLNAITSIFGAILCLVATWSGAEVTWDFFQRHVVLLTALEPPKFIIFAVIPVGFFLLFAQFLRRACGFLGNFRASRHRE